MHVEATEVDGVVVLTLAGEFDDLAGAAVSELAADLIQGGRSRVILDLAGVERIYSAGIAALIRLQRETGRRGVRLICCGVRPYIRELLRVTMPDRALELQIDLESALDRCREAS